jgi:hypothetical protein
MHAGTQAYIDSFNKKMGEFLAELSTTFPEIQDLRLLKTSFTMMRSISDKTPQKLFDVHVALRFGEQILRRDESFFLAYDYTDVIANIPGVETKESLDIVGQLKAIWHSLSDSNKEAVWKYLAVLLYLNSKCK